MLCDSAIYMIYFLAISTTNRLATAIAQDDSYEKQKIISHGLGIATVLGMAISLSTCLFGKRLLYWIVGGPTVTDIAGMSAASVLQSAYTYCVIRSLAATASVVGMVAQAICLASLDMKTPTLAVLVASTCNMLGDFLLCSVWKLGSNGAAAATALATVASAMVLLSSTRKTFRESHQTMMLEQSSSSQHENTRSPPPFISLPDKKSFLQLFQLAGPIAFVMMGKIVCYNAMTLKANMLGMVTMTAHSIMLRVFFFFGTFADSLSQAAQTFFPGILYGNTDDESSTSGSVASETTEDKANGAYIKQFTFRL